MVSSDIKVNIMKKVLRDSVKEFIQWFNEEGREYFRQREADWYICWNEHDLGFHLGRMLRKGMSKKPEFRGYEIHQCFKLNPNYFDVSEKNKKILENALSAWRKFRESNKAKAPEVDLMVVNEIDPIPLLLAVELKHYHYDKRQWGVSPKEAFKKDLKKLKLLLRTKACELAAFVYLDDYYSWKSKNMYKRLVSFAKKYETNRLMIFPNLKPSYKINYLLNKKTRL